MGILLAFFGSLTAACCDIEGRRIPNGLIVLMWVAGAALATGGGKMPAEDAAQKIAAAAAGAALPVFALMPLWRLRAMGAGDIKLLSGLGGLLGVRTVAWVFAAAVFCAGLIGAGLILEEGFPKAGRAGIHFAVPVFMGVVLTAGPSLC